MSKVPQIWHLIVLILMNMSKWANGVEQVPCYFVFGDSLWDNGNNNPLPTKAKANFPPYGIDFPGGATGRFTNGRNMADIIAQHLGFEKFIPSFASNANDQEIVKGVNYASGGAGIRSETGQKNLGSVISLDTQLQNHQKTIERITKTLGNNEAAAKHLNKCMYTVGMGSNDYINNYLLPQFYTTHTNTPDQYATLLVEQLSNQLKTLHNLGARKIAVFGLGLIGCTPGSIAMYGPTNGSACVTFIQDDVQIFNKKLVSLVDELNRSLPDAKFIYVNIFGMAATPPSSGTKMIVLPCCDVGNLAGNNGVLTCIPSGKVCPNRADHLLFDATHPTEVSYVMLGGRAYNAQRPDDTYPIDINRLAQLNSIEKIEL